VHPSTADGTGLQANVLWVGSATAVLALIFEVRGVVLSPLLPVLTLPVEVGYFVLLQPFFWAICALTG